MIVVWVQFKVIYSEKYITIKGVIDSLGSETPIYLQNSNIGDSVIFMFKVDQNKQAKPEIPLYQTIGGGKILHIYFSKFMGVSLIQHQNSDNNSRYSARVKDSINMFWQYEYTDETAWSLKILCSMFNYNVGDLVNGYEEIINYVLDKKAKYTFTGQITRIDDSVMTIYNEERHYELVKWKAGSPSKVLKIRNTPLRCGGVNQYFDAKGRLLNSYNIIGKGQYFIKN